MSPLILIEVKLADGTLRNCVLEMPDSPGQPVTFSGLPLKPCHFSHKNPLINLRALHRQLAKVGAKILSLSLPTEFCAPPVPPRQTKPAPVPKRESKKAPCDELYLGETLLGRFVNIDYDWPVVYADLRPTKAFRRFKARFEALRQAEEDPAQYLRWKSLINELDKKGLRIKMPDGVLRRFGFSQRGQGFAYLRIKGRKVSWRPS